MNLAIIAESEALPPRNPSNDDVVLWDLSNPAAPRAIVQKFSGVVKVTSGRAEFVVMD